VNLLSHVYENNSSIGLLQLYQVLINSFISHRGDFMRAEYS